MISPGSAQETDFQIKAMQEELGEIRKKMDDLVKSEAVLRDRQTTRMMRLEEDIDGIRQDIGRQISETEQRLSQEQSLIREYIGIINDDIGSFDLIINELETDLEALESGHEDIEQSLAGIRAYQEQMDEEISSANERISSADEWISSAEERISSVDAAVSGLAGKIDELGNFEENISGIVGDVSRLESELSQLSSMLDQESEERISDIQNLEDSIREEISGLFQKISYTDQGIVDRINTAESRISYLNEYIEERELFAVGAIIGLGFLILLVAVGTIASRRKTMKVERKLEQKNSELNHRIEEQSAVLDTRLIELLEKQIPLLSGADSMPVHPGDADSAQITDHTLAIALGEEIYNLMKRNKDLTKKTQIFEELKTSLRRLWTAFREKGYELVDLQGKKYHEDMPAKAEFFLTHELLPGEQFVSRVIRPLIKHNGVTIQEAEIEVMVGD